MADVAFDWKVLTARKPHVCQQCGRRIAPGERYRRDTGVFDGSFYSMACCPQCESLARELQDQGIDDYDTGGWRHLPDVDHDELDRGLDYVRMLRALVLFRRRWCRPDGSLDDYPKSSNRGEGSDG